MTPEADGKFTGRNMSAVFLSTFYSTGSIVMTETVAADMCCVVLLNLDEEFDFLGNTAFSFFLIVR